MRSFAVLLFLVAAVSGSSQSVRLQLKFPKGHADRMVTSMKMTQSFGVPGSTQKMEMKMDQSMTMLMRVVSSGQKGASVKMTYEKMSSNMTMNGQKTPTTEAIEKAVRGKAITVDFAPSGKVTRVRGIKELMASSMQGSPPEMQRMFEQMFSEKSVRDMWSMMFGGVFPAGPVRVGQSWASKLSIGTDPMVIQLNLKMNLKGIESRRGHKMARIELSGNGSMSMSGLGDAGVNLRTEQFSVSGTSFFDLDRGWMSDQAMAMSVKGTLSSTRPGAGQATSLTMHMTSSTKVTPAR